MRIEEVKIDSPCDADWGAMHGDEKRRFCDACAKSVHHLSAMTRREAEALLETREAGLCVRYCHDEAGEVKFASRVVMATAPWWQVGGVRRLVSGAMALMATTVLAQSIALAQPSPPQPIAGGIRPVHDPGVIKPPPGECTQPEEPCEGSGEADGSAVVPQIQEHWMGEMPSGPIEQKAAALEKNRRQAAIGAIREQERAAARILGQFGLSLEEVEFAGDADGLSR